ncbi:hypothetical protein B0H66DRAFT_1071 [Apodospora peruviana]|uniref:Uncharacterized protein n=1 Tax=Apodospora peruviana TaxID=516989 RepID=A0AAE0MEG9_9PEZI|nr:hypothetical protein B0H66DRAFT_1071 [Apodospora peruviana]
MECSTMDYTNQPADTAAIVLCHRCHGLLDLDLAIVEHIDTLITNDSSWCPYRIRDRHLWERNYWDSNGVWFESRGEPYSGGHLQWDTTDESCRSVMRGIESFNHYKSVQTPIISPLPLNDFRSQPDCGAKDDPEGYGYPYKGDDMLYACTESILTTPLARSDIRPSWLASIDYEGNILIPLVTRLVAEQRSDVFGNDVRSMDSAFFPDHFLWVGLPDGGDNPCMYPLYTMYGKCTSTEPSTLLTSWWILPLSKPTTSSGIPNPTATTTASLPTSSPMPTPVVRLTSAVLTPTPTCCDKVLPVDLVLGTARVLGQTQRKQVPRERRSHSYPLVWPGTALLVVLHGPNNPAADMLPPR